MMHLVWLVCVSHSVWNPWSEFMFRKNVINLANTARCGISENQQARWLQALWSAISRNPYMYSQLSLTRLLHQEQAGQLPPLPLHLAAQLVYELSRRAQGENFTAGNRALQLPCLGNTYHTLRETSALILLEMQELTSVWCLFSS